MRRGRLEMATGFANPRGKRYFCRTMKRILCILSLILALTSCHKKIWDKLNDHEERIARLEAFCNQMNTNINSLQALVNVLNARDYVKDIVPVMENGNVIGYTITFASASPITVYNGKNGEDAPMPVIGIKQDTDGIWYWTLDGKWLIDDKGSKVRADAAMPKLKIEDDYWWASYDNGSTWEKLGKAIGTSGEGDAMFRSIYWDDDYVYLILADGQEIKLARNHGLTWIYV